MSAGQHPCLPLQPPLLVPAGAAGAMLESNAQNPDPPWDSRAQSEMMGEKAKQRVTQSPVLVSPENVYPRTSCVIVCYTFDYVQYNC